MKAFLLSAGDSTRMRPLTANTPKPLLFVAGKPFLQHTIEVLKEQGIKEIVILIGWRMEKIKEYFGNGKKFGVKISYIEQEERKGTAHATSFAKELKEFISINGDVVLTKEMLKGLLNFYKKNKGITMTLAKVENPKDFGVVEVKNEKVIGISEKPEKPKSNLVNAGIYIFNQEIFSAIEKTPLSRRGEYEITDALNLLAKDEKVFAYITEEKWIDVGYPWQLLNANELLLKNLKREIKGEVEKNTTIIGNVHIGKNTIVRNGAYIIGNVFIGDNCEIGPNCFIRPFTAIANSCKVGNASEVKNSIIMEGSHIPHLNYVGDSIIGQNCNLGAGTKIANLRLDEKNISCIVKGKKIDTQRRKLGAIIGDNVKTGINASFDVGTIVGENSFIGINAFVKGTIEGNSRIY